MWWAVFRCAKVGLVALVISIVFSSSAQAWSVSSQPQYLLSPVKDTNQEPCAGMYTTIALHDEGSVSACVMGHTTQVAAYFSSSGLIMHAVRLPFDNSFYRLDMCVGTLDCVYSEKNDTLFANAVIYKNFVAHLAKTIRNGVIYYGLSEDSSIISVIDNLTPSFWPQSVAISENGQWFLVEIRDVGIFRINYQTLDTRRIIAPGFSYGYGADPRVELAISNDGGTVAVMGMRKNVGVILVDDTCGDRYTGQMQLNFAITTRPCSYLDTPTQSYTLNFSYALKPKFSQDDKSLSFDIFGRNVSPRHVTLFSNERILEPRGGYLAIGDSFTSGEGEVDDAYYIGGPKNRCHVSARSYPYLVASEWGAIGFNAACSGATIQTARGEGSHVYQTKQVAEIESRLPQFLSVSIGGNDAGLMGKLKSCIGVGTCEWANSPEKRRATALEIKDLYQNLKQFYQQLKIKTPGEVFVIGYPLIISANISCLDPVGVLLDQTERQFITQSLQYLNQVIQNAANDTSVRYVNVEDAFRGSELCASPSSDVMNGLRLGDDIPILNSLPSLKVIGAESFHPKPYGHEKLKEAILRTFLSTSAISGCIACTQILGAPTPGEYWDSNGINLTAQHYFPFLNKANVKKDEKTEISLPTFSLEPLSNVEVELHSDIKNLGTVLVASDGSLQIEISAMGSEPGFHSVHVIGKNSTGKNVDLYDFLMIEEVVGDNNEATNNNAPLIFSNAARNSAINDMFQAQSPTRSSGGSERVAGVRGVSTAAPTMPIAIKYRADRHHLRYEIVILIGIVAGLMLIGIITVWVLEQLLKK